MREVYGGDYRDQDASNGEAIARLIAHVAFLAHGLNLDPTTERGLRTELLTRLKAEPPGLVEKITQHLGAIAALVSDKNDLRLFQGLIPTAPESEGHGETASKELIIIPTLSTLIEEVLGEKEFRILLTDAQRAGGVIANKFIDTLTVLQATGKADKASVKAHSKRLQQVFTSLFRGDSIKKIAESLKTSAPAVRTLLHKLKANPEFADWVATAHKSLSEVNQGGDSNDGPYKPDPSMINVIELHTRQPRASAAQTQGAVGRAASSLTRQDPSPKPVGNDLSATGPKRPLQTDEEDTAIEKLDQLEYADANPIHNYLNTIGKYELLTPEEEVALAKAIEAGLFAAEALEKNEPLDEEQVRDLEILVREGEVAKEQMINSNLRLVVSNAKLYIRKTRSMDLGDLIQEGNFGLIRAVEMFDYTKGFKFSTYATRWIKGSIDKGIDAKDRGIRYPSHILRKERKLFKSSQEFLHKYGRKPTDEELTTIVGFDVTVHKVLTHETIETLSLNWKLDEQGSAESGDFVSTPELPSQNEAIGEVVNQSVINLFVQCGLTDQEIDVVCARHGFGTNEEPKTLGKAGLELGLSGERIRQIQNEGLEKIQQNPDAMEALWLLLDNTQ